jgi:hypothetical protein
MAKANKTRHWLEKAIPKYAKVNRQWRVRLMHKGQKYQWWFKNGLGDPSSTGQAQASAEWERTKAQILVTETGAKNLGMQSDGTFLVVTDNPFEQKAARVRGEIAIESYDSEEEYKAVLNRQTRRFEYEDCPVRDKLSFQEYCAFVDFLNFNRNRTFNEAQAELVIEGHPLTDGPSSSLSKGEKPFSDLLEVWRQSLKITQAGTIKGMDDGQGMGKSRLEQYEYSINHMVKTVGKELCEPLAAYHVSELQLESILTKYRAECKKQVAEAKEARRRGRGIHWFYEKMKASRKLTTFLVGERLCNGTPAGIKICTKKFKIKSKALAIPLPILRAFWKEADSIFRTYMLLALNFGFRQTEIDLLNWDDGHVQVVAGRTVVDKDRNKTGVKITIPFWKKTLFNINQNAQASGKFFFFEGTDEKAAIECIGKRWNKLRLRVMKSQPEAKSYCFENLRDTGASYLQTINPFLVPFYLGQTTKGDAAKYLGEIKDEKGVPIVPMFLDDALDKFEAYLNLPD